MNKKFLKKVKPGIVIINDNEWIFLLEKDLVSISEKFFNENLKGIEIYNKDNGAKIILAKTGWRHTIMTEKKTYENIVIFKKLKEVIENAKFEYFRPPDEKDAKTTIGFFNYRCNVLINGSPYIVKIVIRIDKNGKFYYHHYIIK